MNLNELFTKQQRLDDYIIKEKRLEGQDLFKRKIVAFLAELYECANEGRWFKFWSDNATPNRTGYINCDVCINDQPGSHEIYDEEGGIISVDCPKCDGHEEVYVGNRLLEEYVDSIHFALSIANDLGVHEHKYLKTQPVDLNDLIIGITNIATILPMSKDKHHVASLLNNLIALGYQLGFTEQDVIQAYDDKNKENYKRQDEGY